MTEKKLKVKFVGRFRDYIQCRKTKVRVTMPPRQVENLIKYHNDSSRDLENILEVLQKVDLKNERPCVGELLANTAPGGRLSEDATPWSVMDDFLKLDYQEWGERFINALQGELYLTESLQSGDADNYSDNKARTVQAIREILERR